MVFEDKQGPWSTLEGCKLRVAEIAAYMETNSPFPIEVEPVCTELETDVIVL